MIPGLALGVSFRRSSQTPHAVIVLCDDHLGPVEKIWVPLPNLWRVPIGLFRPGRGQLGSRAWCGETLWF
jgi:hypothetical protein